MTDQQFADAMSCCIGKEHIHTPNMDSLAAAGMRFTRAYTANPLCVPARTSMFTGRYPHETGIQTNTNEKIDPEKFPCLGRVFRSAGYETGFFGKWHMPFAEARKDQHGFETCVIGKQAIYDGGPVAQFIRKRRERPFLAVASFLNPHNICEWSRGQTLPGGSVGEPPAPEQCPPLKPNMAPPAGETDIIAHMRRAYQAHPLFPVGDFSDAKWRQYLWAYYRLIEKVDQNVGTVLEALRESGQEQNTVVVFLSDHGECHGTHRWNQKTVFYDESARVPLLISQKGTTRLGVCDALVQTGVDLIPTLCEFAGIATPRELPGRGLRGHAMGQGSGGGSALSRRVESHGPVRAGGRRAAQARGPDGPQPPAQVLPLQRGQAGASRSWTWRPTRARWSTSPSGRTAAKCFSSTAATSGNSPEARRQDRPVDARRPDVTPGP